MSTIPCPHCGTENLEGGAFCQQCGKALPSAAPTGPRIVTGEQIATTAVGQDLQGQQLRKQAGKAAGALFAVAILTAISGVVFYFLLKNTRGVEANVPMTVLITNLVLAGIYAGMGFWARVSPLPAAIAGLVLFVTVIVVNVVMDPTSIVQGIIVKVIVIVVLIKAIQAGTKHRQLQVQSPAQGTAGGQ